MTGPSRSATEPWNGIDLAREFPGEDMSDPRVVAVIEVIAGRQSAEVAERHRLDPTLLRRWVRDFLDAGIGRITNRPDEQAARQRDRFLAALAHETRTPLAAAQGWASMLADGSSSPLELDTAASRLREALDRLTERIVDVELLAVSSLGRLVVNPVPARIDVMTSSLPGLDGVGGEGGELEIEVDPAYFSRVLRDLWLAGHALPRPRSLRLEVVIVEPWAEIRVVRDADPIDPAVLQALFDPFEFNDDGTGVTIGLYLARALTVAHGGTIGVDQDEDGAALWVRVPHHRADPRML